ncbi:hypothetical protein Ddc_00547 [Ditylenchus destructor]|nr:hypothetical protein Ddc_00547 [Ditylenchus destructor]
MKKIEQKRPLANGYSRIRNLFVCFILLTNFPVLLAVDNFDTNNNKLNHSPNSISNELPSHSNTKGFWLATELLAADFRKGCLSTALCHEPRLRVVNSMTVSGEETVMSWPANGARDLVQEHSRPFVTYWTEGDPEDIAMSISVAGTDPSFGFSRICDETPTKRVFNEAIIHQALIRPRWQESLGRYERSIPKSTRQLRHVNGSRFHTARDDNGDRMIVELRGKCFNATLSVSKHIKRCPWCPDPNMHVVVVGGASGQQSGEKDSSEHISQNSFTSDALFFHNCIIVALSGAVVFLLTGLCSILTLHCRYRKRHSRKMSGNSSKRLLKSVTLSHKQCPQQYAVPISPPNMHKIAEPTRGRNKYFAENQADDKRYDTPWDRKYHPLPHLIGNNMAQQWMVNCSPEDEPKSSAMDTTVDTSLRTYDTSGSSIVSNPPCNAKIGGAVVTIPPVVNHRIPHHNNNNGWINHREALVLPASGEYATALPPVGPPCQQPFSPHMSRHDDSGLESV